MAAPCMITDARAISGHPLNYFPRLSHSVVQMVDPVPPTNHRVVTTVLYDAMRPGSTGW